MAGLFKRRTSRYFTAIFYDGTGLKRRRSTKQTDKRKAMVVALQMEKLAKAGKEKRLTEAMARRVVSDILEEVTGERLTFYSAKDWFAEWIRSKTGTVEQETIKRHKQVLDGFLEHLGPRQELTIEGVTTKDVRAYRDAVAGSLAISTTNQTIRKFLSATFLAAVRQGLIKSNPCAAVPNLRDEDDIHRDTFAAVQISMLLRATDEFAETAANGEKSNLSEETAHQWKGVILCGYFTGLRLSDITNLTWGDVDLKALTLKIVPKKTRRFNATLLIPLHPDFVVFLQSHHRGIAMAPLFPSLAGQRTGGKTGLSGQFSAIMAKAKIAGRLLRGGDGKGRKTSSLSFHSLRHSFVSALAAAGVPQELRMKLSGHADVKSHAIYTHHEIETLRGAMAKMPSLIASLCIAELVSRES